MGDIKSINLFNPVSPNLKGIVHPEIKFTHLLCMELRNQLRDLLLGDLTSNVALSVCIRDSGAFLHLHFYSWRSLHIPTTESQSRILNYFYFL